MNIDQALSELNELVNTNQIKYSEFEEIKSQVLHLNGASSDTTNALNIIAFLVDNNHLSHEAYGILRAELLHPEKRVEVRSVSSTGEIKKPDDKPIKGALLGFLLGFFLGILGMIIGIFLGDEACKKHAIIWGVVDIVLGIVISIIYIVMVFVLASTGTTYLVPLFLL